MGPQRPILAPDFEVLTFCPSSRFVDKKTQSQRGDVTCSTPHSPLVTKRLELMFPVLRADVRRQENFHFFLLKSSQEDGSIHWYLFRDGRDGIVHNFPSACLMALGSPQGASFLCLESRVITSDLG